MLIIPANTLASGGFAVDNSCRFNSGSSDNLSKTFGSGNQKTWTWSGWIKLANIESTSEVIFGRLTATNDSNWFTIDIRGNDKITIGIYNTNFLITNRLFRDVSAWYHIVVAFDTTQSTADNRIKLYVNGVEETSFATRNNPSQDTDYPLNANVEHLLGKSWSTYYEGYMSEITFIDGLALAPTDFGEFDEDSGIWKPIDVSGLTFGTNGFYLDFKDSAALGDDVSGNGNDFTVNNLTAIDQATDTPTNNFCTMNPLYPDGTITFSEGNLKLTIGSSWRSAGGTMAVSQGKWYWEVSNVGNYAYIGFADIQLFNEGCSIRESFTTGAATTGNAYSVGNSDGRLYQVTSGGAQTSDYPASATFSTFTNSIIGIALNLDDNEATFYKDGTAMNGGTAISITAGTYIPAVSVYGNNLSMNFGNPPFTISSGNADGNGYGNFEYAVPSGYLSLCTANLSEVLS